MLALAALLGASCGESEAPGGALLGAAGVSTPGAPGVPRLASAGKADWVEYHDGGITGRDSPGAGEDIDAAYDSNRRRLYIYGGKGDDNLIVAELWSFDFATNRWSQIVSEGSQPPPREDHTLVFDELNDALVLYGGEDGLTSNETWAYHLKQQRWEDITHATAPLRENHIAAYDPQGRRMVVFGGVNGPKMDDETWALDLDPDSPGYRAWSVLTTSQPRPQARREHSGAFDPVRRRLLVFGGRDRTKDGFLDDLWSLSLEDGRWEEVVTTGDKPDPARQAVLGYDPRADRMTLFGGEALSTIDGDPDEFLTDRIWVLDLASGVWEDRTPAPRPVYDHVGVFIPELGGTWIYGGSTDRPEKVHKIWLLRDGSPEDG